MFVKDIMSRNLFTLRKQDRLDQAQSLMDQETIQHIPIVDQKQRLVGLVTSRELLRASVSIFSDLDVDEKRDLYHHISLSEIMIEDVLTTSPKTPLSEAARIMEENEVGCLPVMQDDVLVGLITETDFLHVIAEQKPELYF